MSQLPQIASLKFPSNDEIHLVILTKEELQKYKDAMTFYYMHLTKTQEYRNSKRKENEKETKRTKYALPVIHFEANLEDTKNIDCEIENKKDYKIILIPLMDLEKFETAYRYKHNQNQNKVESYAKKKGKEFIEEPFVKIEYVINKVYEE